MRLTEHLKFSPDVYRWVTPVFTSLQKCPKHDVNFLCEFSPDVYR